MYLPWNASKARLREAEHARRNRAEIVAALSQGQISRRDLIKWGLITAGGLLIPTHGLSPFAKSAFAEVPTGTPPSPLFGADNFTQPLPRLHTLTPIPLRPVRQIIRQGRTRRLEIGVSPGRIRDRFTRQLAAQWGPAAMRMANTTPVVHQVRIRDGINTPHRVVNGPVGPAEGRPPGEFFAHQRWQEFLPKVGYLVSMGQCAAGNRFHPLMPEIEPNRCWTFGEGRSVDGTLPPILVKARYGEPVLFRHYNNLPLDRSQNGGFGLNETSTHNHNAHNGAESDGAQNAHFFPGEYYDYHWSTTLARHDMINRLATDPRASGPDDRGGLVMVPGDFRELQSTLWFHDHRFFFTSENVYKGHVGMLNYYSGPDRGYESPEGLTAQARAVNLRLPSGSLNGKTWGNQDFDVNLLIGDMAYDPSGQMFFDIFDTDGFLGDIVYVNYAYYPYLDVLPRKYRFRILSASMSRWYALALADQNGSAVPVQVIANDGNLFPRPVTVTELIPQGTAERLDIVVDFSTFKPGDTLHLVNQLEFSDGRKPDRRVSLAEALAHGSPDPGVGPIMEFRIVSQVASVDAPGTILKASDPDLSQVPDTLTEQIPIVEPVRERFVEFVRTGDDDSGVPLDPIPEGLINGLSSRQWAVKVNGEDAHHLDARRVSNLIPRPGEVEHWTLINGGGGWDHPVHLHFEEGVTITRFNDPIPATELLKRKDVWRLGPSGQVKFQVRFGEYGGAYVNHCHNTVHEDFAMLLRYDILSDRPGDVHIQILPTPDPKPEGVGYVRSCFLPEGHLDPSVSPGADQCPSDGPIGPAEPVPAV